MRYQVIEGSETGHCCFEATIVDTSKPQTCSDGTPTLGGPEGTTQLYKQLCECLYMKDAEFVARALNLADTYGITVDNQQPSEEQST